MITIRITGDRALRKKFATLVPKLQKRVLSKSARVAMKPLLDKARSNAPIGQTGKLKKAIKLKTYRKNRRGIVGLSVALSDKFFTGLTFYGAFVEFGHHLGKREKRLRVGKQWSGIGGTLDKRVFLPGQHFLEEAYSSGREAAAARFLAQIPIELDRVLTGGPT